MTRTASGSGSAAAGTRVDDSYDVVSPRADHLMESLRGAGYSLPAAVSDLIDNSITAGAGNIWLNFHWSGANSRVSILDDGCGMSETELVDAMRIGSRSPREERDSGRPGAVRAGSEDGLDLTGSIADRRHPHRVIGISEYQAVGSGPSGVRG